jgi:hypothetical protein
MATRNIGDTAALGEPAQKPAKELGCATKEDVKVKRKHLE